MISIIVPTLNEAANLPDLLTHLRGLRGSREVIVVDGGSDDDTRRIASAAPDVRLIESRPGRGTQIAAGAAAARGAVIAVLHADGRLPKDGLRIIEDALSGRYRWGWFDIQYDSPRFSLKAVAMFLNIRSRIIREPTGENIIFAETDAWHEVGGSPDEPIMEDLILARRLRKTGPPAVLRGPAIASARRYEWWGVPQMCLRCAVLWSFFHLGVRPERLAPYYSTNAPKEPSERDDRITA